MKHINRKNTWILGLVFGLLAAGCASDEEGLPPELGDAYLTIQGANQVYLENGWQQVLTVRYHNAAGQGLAGDINFSINGSAAGAILSSSAIATDGNGIAKVTLTAGSNGSALFNVTAQDAAAYASHVQWEVEVNSGNVVGDASPEGRYKLLSEFDMVSGIPGPVGNVINTFLDMTDDDHDPATFLLDLAVGESQFGASLAAARPGLDALINSLILHYSPDFITKVLDLGSQLEQAARHFRIASTLEVTENSIGGGVEYTASHVQETVIFIIDEAEYDFNFQDDLGFTPTQIPNLAFAPEGSNRWAIEQHTVPFSYGAMLLAVINKVIIPKLNPNADNLTEYFQGLVKCNEWAGANDEGETTLGDQLLISACEVAVSIAVNYLEGQLLNALDGNGMAMTLEGSARPIDTNGDKKVDVWLDGVWEGNMAYVGQEIPLGDSTFRGDRINGVD